MSDQAWSQSITVLRTCLKKKKKMPAYSEIILMAKSPFSWSRPEIFSSSSWFVLRSAFLCTGHVHRNAMQLLVRLLRKGHNSWIFYCTSWSIIRLFSCWFYFQVHLNRHTQRRSAFRLRYLRTTFSHESCSSCLKGAITKIMHRN